MLLNKKQTIMRENAVNNILKYCTNKDNYRALFLDGGHQKLLTYNIACELYIPSTCKYKYSEFDDIQHKLWTKKIAPYLKISKNAQRVHDIEAVYRECITRLKDGIRIINYTDTLYFDAQLLKWLIMVVAPKNNNYTYISTTKQEIVIESEYGIGILASYACTKEQYNKMLLDACIKKNINKRQSKILENVANVA